jgi:hypothetical protein
MFTTFETITLSNNQKTTNSFNLTSSELITSSISTMDPGKFLIIFDNVNTVQVKIITS